MRLTNDGWLQIVRLTTMFLALLGLGTAAHGQAVATTTVQGTIYLANGQPGGGTLMVSWPSFTTAAGQLVAADRASATIGSDGFVSINLAPNQGATPAGQYYTAVFYMSDGTVNTQYWIVPAAAQAALAQVQAQIMPAAQAVQAVSKAYVDQAISEATQSALGGAGGVLAGPLYLSGDPSQPLQAADKHYVDSQLAAAVPLTGGNMSGPLTTPGVNGIEAPAGTKQATLQATINAAGANGAMEIPPTYAGTDTFTNPDGVRVTDLRNSVAQQTERSVKEFGAVCDGVTDDTNALQSAINYAQTHGVALTIPQGTCKTRTLNWHGESIGGLGKQVSALMGFPGQDVLATTPDNPNILSYTRLHDLTIYVDQSQDVSCSPAKGRAAAGSCQLNRPLESNTIFSPGGNGLSGTQGSGTGWAVGNCAIVMQATTGAGGNGLKNAQIENLEIVATGTDPMATQYPGAHSTHTCGLYLAQWPQWSEFKNIDIRGLNTGIAIPALAGTAPAGLLADSNRWQNITIQAAHGFIAAAGCNGIVDDLTAMAANSAATGEAPTGLILDLQSAQEGWTVRNTVVMPNWNAVQPVLTVTAASGAVSGVTLGAEHGLGWDPYGTTVPVAFSGSCTAQANAAVNSDGSIGAISVSQVGSGCSSTTTASINAPGNWDTAAPVNLIGGQNMTFFAGSLLRGHGGYTVWNASGAQSYGTQVNGGGGNLPGGGSYPAFVANSSVGSTLQVDQFPGADFGAKLQACVNAVNTNFGGTCDARNFTGNQTMSANLTISTPNTNILLPCATISTANQIIVTAGTRNVALRGCAMRGGSAASGSQGGTAFAFSGTGSVIQVGDPTYAVNTPGFHIDNSVINTTGASSASAQGLIAYRTQEIDLEDMYFLGNSNQTGATLDGTGNYTGGTIRSVQFGGFQTAINAIGHQVANTATTDWMNASTFVRLHIDCPTSNGYPIAGTIGINLQQGDGNTFTGGDVEGCATALHLGANAQNNTIIGLRNENSTNQVVADAGSAYNNWITGGTMFTGQLSDNGTRNSFQDTFHRSFNGMNGDWYGSQQDATVTNHFRLGTGNGNERGLLNEYQTDSGNRWTEGLSDATGGEQFYQILDQMNNVYRLSIGQYNNGQSSTNNQTAMNSAGTGAVVLNSTTNSGTGGVIFGSGGASPSTVATVDNSGNAHYNGTLQVGGTAQSTGTMTVRNNADSEVDYYLWPGLTTSQKGSFTYKDWNGNSQWYMVKDSSNNWALNSAPGGLDSFKAYQSTNSGDTYINASNSSGHIRLNYESGSGAETDIYSGASSNLVASFVGPTAIKLPGLAAGAGHNCVQIDNSGYLTNTGFACGSGYGTVSSGNSGQIAYYTSSGTTIAGTSAVPLSAGGTGSTSAAGAVANLLPGVATDGNQGVTVAGNAASATTTIGLTTTLSPGQNIQAAITAGATNILLAPGTYTGPTSIPNGVIIRCQSWMLCTLTYFAPLTIGVNGGVANFFEASMIDVVLDFGGASNGLTLNDVLNSTFSLTIQNTPGTALSIIGTCSTPGDWTTCANNPWPSSSSAKNNITYLNCHATGQCLVMNGDDNITCGMTQHQGGAVFFNSFGFIISDNLTGPYGLQMTSGVDSNRFADTNIVMASGIGTAGMVFGSRCANNYGDVDSNHFGKVIVSVTPPIPAAIANYSHGIVDYFWSSRTSPSGVAPGPYSWIGNGYDLWDVHFNTNDPFNSGIPTDFKSQTCWKATAGLAHIAQPITSYSESGGTLTLTAANDFTVGESVQFSVPAGDPLVALNGLYFGVLSAGLDGAHFAVSTGSVTGSGTTSTNTKAVGQITGDNTDFCASTVRGTTNDWLRFGWRQGSPASPATIHGALIDSTMNGGLGFGHSDGTWTNLVPAATNGGNHSIIVPVLNGTMARVEDILSPPSAGVGSGTPSPIFGTTATFSSYVTMQANFLAAGNNNVVGSSTPINAMLGVLPPTVTNNVSSNAGRVFQVAGGTINRTADSGTYTRSAQSSLGVMTLQAGAATTYTNASTLFLVGAPVASTNVTITNPWTIEALGPSYFDSLSVGGQSPCLANGTNCPSSSTNATNLAGGAVGSAPYQNAAAATAFISSPTTSGHTFVYGWRPSGSAVAPTAVDITPSLTNRFTTTLGSATSASNSTATATYYYAPSYEITVTSLTLHISPQANCSSAPTVDIWDVTAGSNLGAAGTVTNSVAYQVFAGLSVNVPASHLLTFAVVTSSGACTTYPTLNGVAEYKMYGAS